MHFFKYPALTIRTKFASEVAPDPVNYSIDPYTLVITCV